MNGQAWRIAGSLLGPVLLAAGGWGLLRFVPALRREGPFVRAGFAYLLGAAWTGISLVAASHLAGLPLGRTTILCVVLLPLVAGVIRAMLGKNANEGETPAKDARAWIALAVVLGAGVTGVLLLDAVTNPITDWDGRMTWAAQARFIREERTVSPTALREEQWHIIHPRYPVLLPVLQVATLETFGASDDERWIRPLYAAFFPAFLAVLFGAASHVAGRRGAAWACIVACLVPFLTFESHGGPAGAYSDFPLACFIGGALALLLARRARWREAAAGGLLLAAAVWTKKEGLPIAIVVLVSALVPALRLGVGRGRWNRLVLHLRGLLPSVVFVGAAALLLVTWRSGIADRNTDHLTGSPPALVWNLGRRLPDLAAAAFSEIRTERRVWGWWPAVVAVALVAGARGLRRGPARPYLAAAIGIGAVHIGAYAATGWETRTIVKTTLSRFATQNAIPLLVLLAVALAEIVRPSPMEPAVPKVAARRLAVACLCLLALLRLCTLAPDPWEWDEILFTNAVAHGIDTRVNHPHAPGYPAFILLGRGIAALGAEPFEAASLAGVAGGLTSMAGFLFLLTTMGISFRWALFAVVGYALTPAVWLHGVRPLSDAPGAAAFLFASAFLVRCGREGAGRDLVLGALFAALAAAVRPQVGLALLPLAAWGAGSVGRRRAIGPLVVAVGVGLGVSAFIWIPAIAGSGGWESWLSQLRRTMDYVRRVDAPNGAALATVAFWQRWLVDPFGDPWLGLAVWISAGAGVLTQRRKAAIALAVFAPVMALSIGLLAVHTAPRYALCFLPLPWALATLLFETLSIGGASLRHVAGTLGTALLGWTAFRAVPPVVEVATHPSPPVALMTALRDDRALAGRPVVFDPALQVHVEEFLSGRQTASISDAVPVSPPVDGLIAVADADLPGLKAVREFRYLEPGLRLVSRARYLTTRLYDARDGAAVHVPRVKGNGWWDSRRNVAVLKAGAVLEISSAPGPVEIRAVARVLRSPAAIRLESGPEVTLRLHDGEQELSLAGRSEKGREVSLRLRAIEGDVELSDWAIRAFEFEAAGLSDESLIGSVDSPVQGEKVRGDVIIRGWCQDWGGKRVDPVEFRLDGVLIPDIEVRRVARPDVAMALPKMGDTSQAGYEAVVPAGLLSPGRHVLTVMFKAEDGRRRLYPARDFSVVR